MKSNLPTFPLTLRPRDEALKLLVDVQAALGGMSDLRRHELQQLVLRIADCLFEVSGGVSTASAEQLLRVAQAAAIGCAARLDTAETVVELRARTSIVSLELLLAERLSSVRLHRRQTLKLSRPRKVRLVH